MDYAERVAIVTGASSGIGRQTALDFAGRGCRIVISARRGELLRETAAACEAAGAQVEAMTGDLAERAFAESMVERALARFGRVDMLVNNAGIPKHKQFYDVTPEDVEVTMGVNFMAPAYLTIACLPAMLRQGEGYVVNISSAAGRMPPPRESVYAASKYALTGFSEGLALDLAGSGIHVGVIHVGPIDTEIWGKTETETAYKGKRYPPSLISNAVFTCIEQRRHEMTVPRSLTLPYWIKVLLPGLFRWGTARFDPVAPEVIEDAREKARREMPSR
jgi:NAD(P)-dependent dehydrogenase (short-subunit alcohol dehydrogenase family)